MKRLLILVLILLLPPFYFTSAQSGDTPTSSAPEVTLPTETPKQPIDAVVAPIRATSTASTASTTSTTQIAPKITPVESLQVTPPQATEIASPSPSPEISAIATVNYFGLVMALSVVGLTLLGVLALKFKNKSTDNDNKKNDGRCDNIKQLLEQKKKELEDMVRGWPEEKIIKMTKNKILGELKKDENFKEALEIKEGVEDRYNKLKNAIELLQKKYDLCILKPPYLKNKKTILVDAVNTFVAKENGTYKIFQGMFDLLEKYPNKKIIITNANDEEMARFNLINLPYEIFTLKHNPDKTNPEYYKKMLENFKLTKDDVIYFDHRSDSVESARTIGIVTLHYNNEKKNLNILKAFLDKNL